MNTRLLTLLAAAALAFGALTSTAFAQGAGASHGDGKTMEGAKSDTPKAEPAPVAQAPAVADEIQQHMLRIGDPDPAKRPSTLQALAESQRLRERIIAAGAG